MKEKKDKKEDNMNRVFHVPFLLTEWNTVKSAFENRNNATCYEALQVLSAWRLRSSVALPFTVQASEILIQAVMNDHIFLGDASRQNCVESENVRLIYGMAITRFINFVTERGRRDRGPMSTIVDECERVAIPLWVVDLRNAATHGNLPSLKALRESIDFCWSWLLDRYWKNEPLSNSSMNVYNPKSNKKMRQSRFGYSMTDANAASVSTSTSWQLADEDVNWADLPIGLGPGQRVEDLDFRVKPYDPERVEKKKIEETEENSNGIQVQDWDDEKRLELVRGLIAFLGE